MIGSPTGYTDTDDTDKGFSYAPIFVSAAASKLAFDQQPTSTPAGITITPPITVDVEDASGTLVAGDTSSVTLAIATGTGTLSGTLTAIVSDGVPTFSDISLKPTGQYTLLATDGTLTSATSNSFDITGSAQKLAFIQNPSTETAGANIAPSVTVAVEDAAGNIVATDSSLVTLALDTTAAVLHGTLSAAAHNGVATFSQLSVNTIGSYRLVATDGGLTSAKSIKFTVNPAAPSQLSYVQGPTNSVAGVDFTPPVTVEVEDKFGNLDAGTSVSISVFSGTVGFAAGNTLTAVAQSNGIATFANLAVNTAGTYKLAATDGTATAKSSKFTITPAAAAAKLAFLNQPTTTTAGAIISPALVVAIEDQFGNLTTKGGAVTLSVKTPTGTFLGGTATVVAQNGTATFANVIPYTAGTITLKATHNAVSTALSNPFTVKPAKASQIIFHAGPYPADVDATITPPVEVDVENAYGNVETTNTSGVTLSLKIQSGDADAILDGTLTVNAAAGTAIFPDLSVDGTGTFKLIATDGTLTKATSVKFVVT